MLQIKNLRKAYGKYQALDGLSMEVKEGALYGFVGPNGAGKTTTIKILAGLLAADSGQVLLDGENALGRGRKLKGKIGYVPDEFGTYDNLKVREYMEFFCLLLRHGGAGGQEPVQPAFGAGGAGGQDGFLRGRPFQGDEAAALPGSGADP